MFDSIRSYSDQISRNIPDGMVRSGVASFVIGSLVTQNIQAGIVLGGAAATASLIHGLTAPFFRKLFATGNAQWYQTAIQMTVSLGLTQVLVNSFTRFRTNLMAGALFSIGASLALESFQNRQVNKPMTYLVF